MAHLPTSIIFLFDNDAKIRLEKQFIADPPRGRTEMLITRIIHNKLNTAGNTFILNIFRATDPTFLFGLTEESSSYENAGKIVMLSFLEFPFFLLAVLLWVRHWDKFVGKYKEVLYFLGGSLVVVGLISPTFYFPKYFLFLTMLRVFIYLTLFEIFANKFTRND
jgi:hypothetical protein